MDRSGEIEFLIDCRGPGGHKGPVRTLSEPPRDRRRRAGPLAQLLGDVVDEVLAVRELTVGSDSHGVLVHTRC